MMPDPSLGGLRLLLRTPEELLAALAPEGWEQSPFLRLFHPTAEQLRAESADFARNLAMLSRAAGVPPDDAESDDGLEPLIEERPVAPHREVIELIGHVLWDVFSDNNAVIDANGAECALGSFRGSAGTIAEELNTRYADLGLDYDYIDFYMGTVMLGRRADLGPVYRFVFMELRRANYEWTYNYSRLLIARLPRSEEADVDAIDYDPSEAIRSEMEAAEERVADEAFEQTVERINADGAARTLASPPTVVLSYHDVYAKWPDGWPP